MVNNPAMNVTEKKAAISLAAIFFVRMLGLFLVLPVLAIYAEGLPEATPFLVGLAFGAYALTQAILQIPFGWWSDRIGRKPVIFMGLVLFAAGSVVAAMADNIWWIIFGRALQGAGAIAAVAMALLSDITREEHRSKALAIIGVTIGVAFSVAMIVAPILNEQIGLSGIFWLTAILAIFAMLILVLVVPSAQSHQFQRDATPLPERMLSVMADKQLLRMNVSIFFLHLLLMQVFQILPLSLVADGMPLEKHPLLYLPTMLGAMLFMIPLIIFAEKRAKTKPVFIVGVVIILTSVALFLFDSGLWMLVAGLLLFFTGFNALEALLPSLVSKLAPADGKGTAMGVYSTFQFIGAFVGGVSGGIIHQYWGGSMVFVSSIVIILLWLTIVMGMKSVARIRNRVYRAPQDKDLLIEQIKQTVGITEFVFVSPENKVYVKYDADKTNEDRLEALSKT